jgi:PEGA domain-containing protein
MSNITKRITKSVLLVAVLIVTVSTAAHAEPFRGGGFRGRFGPRIGIGIGGFYDPFWGPYYPYGAYPYVVVHPTSKVRVEAVPKETEVFVDGYFAGTAGTVATTPGGHAITLFLPGYRTVTQNIYVRPDSTFKMNDTMDKLGPGEVSAPPPLPGSRVEK